MPFDVTVQNNSADYVALASYDSSTGEYILPTAQAVVAPSASLTFRGLRDSTRSYVLLVTSATGAVDELGRAQLAVVTDFGADRTLPWHGPGPQPAWWVGKEFGGTVEPVVGGDTYYFRYDAADTLVLTVGADLRVTAGAQQGFGQILGDHSVPGAKIDLDVYSAGLEDGNIAWIKINGQNVLPGASRGLNVAVINETTGALIETHGYDTCNSEEGANAFASFVAGLPIGRFVLVAVKDEAASHMNEAARRACEQLGSRLVRNLGYRSSWALIGAQGAPPGSAVETMHPQRGGAAEASVTQMPLRAMIANGIDVVAYSGGYSFGNKAELTIAGRPAGLPNTRGLNAALIDNEGNVLQTRAFDTCGSAQASADFVAWVDALSDGACVAVAVKDEAASHLSAEARNRLEMLGSLYARDIQYRNSFAMVGFKGAVKGSVSEQLCAVAPCEAHYHLLPETVGGDAAASTSSDHGFAISLTSAGYNVGDSASIRIDGVDLGTCGSGINLVEIDEATGLGRGMRSFDTHSDGAADAFAQYIEELVPGQLVALAVKNEAQYKLNDRARRAAAALGSKYVWDLQYQDSWVMLGRKGAAVGSVPEQRSSTAALGLELWFSTSSLRVLRPFRDIVVKSAGFEAGNYASVVVDGVTVGLKPDPSGLERGLYVAVFNEQTGNMEQGEVFDTHASPSRADAFAALIEGLPPGRVVAVGVKDECVTNLTQRARTALISLGGNDINSLQYRMSWAFIGRKGASAQAVSSAYGQGKSVPARASYRLCPKQMFGGQSGFNVTLRSAGHNVGNTAAVYVNGTPANIPNMCGLNVVVFNPGSSAVVATHSYDTSGSSSAGDDFAALIEGLSSHSLVVVAVKDDAQRSLNERARRALRSLGSQLVDRLAYQSSWVMIGNVGYAPGSALEVEFAAGPVSSSIWQPYGGVSPRFGFAILAGIAAVALLGVAIELIYTSLTPNPTTTVPNIIPPAPAPIPQQPVRRGLFVCARTPTMSQPELPRAADRMVHRHQNIICNKLGFDPADTTLITRSAGVEATKARLLAELQKLVTGLKAGDTAYFVFLGHGTTDTRSGQERHAVKVWSDDARSSQVLLYDDEIADVLRNVDPNVNLTCVFHACLSAGLVDDIPALTSRANRGIAITANDRDTPAYLQDGLLVGLEDALAYITTIPSYQHVFDHVVQYCAALPGPYPQRPQMVNMTGNGGGRLQDLNALGYLQKFNF